jgi:glycerol-1-phosphate dehydrogenase [NAD(P)+]
LTEILEEKNMYLNHNEQICACGKIHQCALERVIVGKGVLAQLPEEIRRHGYRKVFVLADANTFAAAGEHVQALLAKEEIPFAKYVYANSPEPDEAAVGAAVMHFDRACDLVLAVGSGVIGDISKILASVSGAAYMIVATAPSMDGYASATSSMTRNGLKVSIPSKSAGVIIGDVDILKNAPMEMLVSGLGDMLAKYISIAEWRISHIVTGEYYCETVADAIRKSLAKCVQNADGLLQRDEIAVQAVFEGLVAAGAAMSYAGTSRPASGVEHYFSHLWDMRGVEFGEKVSTHGIQCAVGTLIAARLYEGMQQISPDREKGLAYAQGFDKQAWFAELAAFLGNGADDMIALDAKEQKYAVEKHAERLERIIEHWDVLTEIMKEEIPTAAFIAALLDKIGCPKTVEAWGLSSEILPMTFKSTKDIRDKYVLSRLAFDLGILEETAALCSAEEQGA